MLLLPECEKRSPKRKSPFFLPNRCDGVLATKRHGRGLKEPSSTFISVWQRGRGYLSNGRSGLELATLRRGSEKGKSPSWGGGSSWPEAPWRSFQGAEEDLTSGKGRRAGMGRPMGGTISAQEALI